MPSSTQEAMDLFAQADADAAAMKLSTFDELTPPFDQPLDARQYNVTVRMLERAVSDLSGGQVTPELPKLGGKVERLPPEVVSAVTALYEFTSDEAFNPDALARDPEAFGNLAGHLSNLRGKDGIRSAPNDPTVVTDVELAAGERSDDAASIAAQLPTGSVRAPKRARGGAARMA